MLTPGPVMSYGRGNACGLPLSLWINTGHWQPALQTFSRIRFPAQQLMLLLFRNHHRLRESILLQ